MTESKNARRHAFETHVQPARVKRDRFIEINTGNVQKELGWQARCRQIVSALWAGEFEDSARVRNLDKPDPKPRESSAVILRFEGLD